MFEIKVVRYVIASHGLRNYKGEDEPIHEHNWRIEVEAASEMLDESGCCIDFHEVDRALDSAMAPFKEKSFNSVSPFDQLSPSAENIAKHLFEVLSKALTTRRVWITRVTACEDDAHRASFKRLCP